MNDLNLSDCASALDSALLSSSRLDSGSIKLDRLALRRLRRARLLSQQELADDCWQRNIRVSIATIKRAESGRAVRFRVARELARCFNVPLLHILDVKAP